MLTAVYSATKAAFAFLRPFAALQTQRYFSQRSGNRSAVGPNGPS